jgi:hypothetical protein
MGYKNIDYIQPFGWMLETTRRVLSAIEYHTRPVYRHLDCDPASLCLAQIAIGLEPEPFGVAHVYNRKPYSNPEHIRDELSTAVDRGWLIRIENDVYQASPKSRAVINNLCQCIGEGFRNLHPLPTSQLDELDGLLSQIIENIRSNSDLSYRPSFELDLKLGIDKGPVLQRICCKLSQILAYRDDAYVSAWMAQDVNSFVWEAFSCVFKGQAQTAQGIADQLGESRHYDLQTYYGALVELQDRGWITQVYGQYEPTQKGIKVVAQVARTLNQSFYLPLAIMMENDLKRMRTLMESLAETLKVKKPAYGVGYASLNRTMAWGSIQWARDKV